MLIMLINNIDYLLKTIFSRKITKDSANSYKDENKLHYFTETSAKTGLNTKEVTQFIIII